jgi:hypothetical protein
MTSGRSYTLHLETNAMADCILGPHCAPDNWVTRAASEQTNWISHLNYVL